MLADKDLLFFFSPWSLVLVPSKIANRWRWMIGGENGKRKAGGMTWIGP